MNFKFPYTILALFIVCEFGQVVFSKTISELSELEKLEDATSDKKGFQETGNHYSLSLFQNDASGSSNLSCLVKSQGGFYQAIKALGVLDLPGVRLVNVSNSTVSYLKKYKKVTKPKALKSHYYHKRDEDQHQLTRNGNGVDADDNNNNGQFAFDDNDSNDDDTDSDDDADDKADLKKRSDRPICQESLRYTSILAHHSLNLAYEIQTRECQGSTCQSKLFSEAMSGASLGQCVQVQNTILVYISNGNDALVPKTIVVGSACKCLSPYP